MNNKFIFSGIDSAVFEHVVDVSDLQLNENEPSHFSLRS